MEFFEPICARILTVTVTIVGLIADCFFKEFEETWSAAQFLGKALDSCDFKVILRFEHVVGKGESDVFGIGGRVVQLQRHWKYKCRSYHGSLRLRPIN